MTTVIRGDEIACPTCKHKHPDGFGLALCLCRDCSLLFGRIPFEHLAPEYQRRLIELERMLGVPDTSADRQSDA